MVRRAVLPLLLVALGLVAAVLVARLPPDYERTVVTRRDHNSDPLLTAVLLRFDVDALLGEPTRYFQPPFLYPDPNPLRGTEPLIAEALLAVPFRVVLGDRPAPLFTWVRLVTLALVTLGTGLMLRELGARPSLALLGGGLSVLIATTAVFFDRLQAVSVQWLPLAVLFAVRFGRSGHVRSAVAFAVSLFLTLQASLYTAVMLLAALPFVAPAGWALRTRAGAGRRVAGLALAAAVAGGVSLLLLWPYLRDRADVAAYSSPSYAGEKSWGAAVLMDPLTSSPEWPFGPPTAWGGVFPGFGFGLLVGVVALLALVDAVRARRRGTGAARRDARWVLGLLLVGFVATVGWSAWRWPTDATRAAATALMWGALVCWSVRLVRWPDVPTSDASRMRLMASTAALVALALFLMSLGSPVRVISGDAPLLEGLFGPLSSVVAPVREMRELRRFLLPAGWAAVVAATLALEVRLRGRPRWVAPLVAVAVLGVGVGERLRADTRKVFAPPVAPGYVLLGDSRGSGGLLELPFDPWGRIKSIHRMLWQPSHGRPIVAGKTGIDPGWYTPARDVFNEFPSEESLLLMRAWGLDSVLERRRPGAALPVLPEGVVFRGRREGPGEVWEWRLFDLEPRGPALEPEPPAGPGAWQSPVVGRDNPVAAQAADGAVETAGEVTDSEGLLLILPADATVIAVQLDYGPGRHNRVPPRLRVLGRAEGEWEDLTLGPGGTHLRARAAHQLLTRQAARLVVPLRPGRPRQLRLVSDTVPWDLPEVRVRVASHP